MLCPLKHKFKKATETVASKKRETAHEVRRTSALRGPERSVDIELSSPGLDSKKSSDTIWYHCFFRARDGDRTRDPLLGKEVLHR